MSKTNSCRATCLLAVALLAAALARGAALQPQVLGADTFDAAIPPGTNPTVWLPTERVARAWQAMVTEQPFDRH